ncbi:uroporphyrinogen-III synthase [Kocuria sp. U4B]|jgi:uroporphyrinogen-III synthase|nr:uroporphyrinogen-III synthase [Kocuria rosea]
MAAEDLPLAGRVVGVTAHRRSEDQIAVLQRRGATVIHAPALKVEPVGEDAPLAAASRALFDARPDLVLITTGYGLRRWHDAAEAQGFDGDLLLCLREAAVYVRGPKGRGAVRGLGLEDAGMAADETTQGLVDLVLAEHGGDLTGRTVGLQLHGIADVAQRRRLTDAGATVLTVTPYRWAPADDAGQVPVLVREAAAGRVDAITFTAAPAVDALFSTAEELGLHEQLLEAFRRGMLAATVGPVTAAPLQELGIEPLVPERFRMGAMLKQLTDALA